jgi:hypothetical protein
VQTYAQRRHVGSLRLIELVFIDTSSRRGRDALAPSPLSANRDRHLRSEKPARAVAPSGIAKAFGLDDGPMHLKAAIVKGRALGDATRVRAELGLKVSRLPVRIALDVLLGE